MAYNYSSLSNALIVWSTTYTIITIVALIIGVPFFIAWCRIFQKVGHPWERMFVPFYNFYTQCSVAHCTALFWVSIFVPFILLLIQNIKQISGIVQILFPVCVLLLYAIYCNKLANAFGKKTGWAIGLFFLHPFFIMGLGFGSAVYQENVNSTKISSDSTT